MSSCEHVQSALLHLRGLAEALVDQPVQNLLKKSFESDKQEIAQQSSLFFADLIDHRYIWEKQEAGLQYIQS